MRHAACPVCGMACTSAEPAWSIRVEPPASYAALMVMVKHRGVAFAVDLHSDAHECPYERLGHMFAIPSARLKIVHKGKLLPPIGEDVEAGSAPAPSFSASRCTPSGPADGSQRCSSSSAGSTEPSVLSVARSVVERPFR